MVHERQGDTLLRAADDAEAALKVQADAKAFLAAVTKDLDAWKEKVNSFRLKIYAELLKISADHNYPRRWAGSFFRTRPRQAGNSREKEQSINEQDVTSSQTAAA